jgi:hypothetical protein
MIGSRTKSRLIVVARDTPGVLTSIFVGLIKHSRQTSYANGSQCLDCPVGQRIQCVGDGIGKQGGWVVDFGVVILLMMPSSPILSVFVTTLRALEGFLRLKAPTLQPSISSASLPRNLAFPGTIVDFMIDFKQLMETRDSESLRRTSVGKGAR